MNEKPIIEPKDHKAKVVKPTTQGSPIPKIEIKVNHHPELNGDLAQIKEELEQERKEAAEKERQRLEELRKITRFD